MNSDKLNICRQCLSKKTEDLLELDANLMVVLHGGPGAGGVELSQDGGVNYLQPQLQQYFYGPGATELDNEGLLDPDANLVVVHHAGGVGVDAPSLTVVGATKVGSMENHEHDDVAPDLYLVGVSQFGSVGEDELKNASVEDGEIDHWNHCWLLTSD